MPKRTRLYGSFVDKIKKTFLKSSLNKVTNFFFVSLIKSLQGHPEGQGGPKI